MREPARRLAGLGVAVLVALPSASPAAPSRATSPAEERARAVHVLNRLAYGPRPGDVEAVARMGVESWIRAQLHPERLSDRTLEARLAPFRTLDMSTEEILEGYEVPRDVKRAVQRKRAKLGEEASEADVRQARREILSMARGRMEGPPRRVIEEAQAAKLVRAVYGERQLDEVMVDFWLNHFNVFAGKGPVKFLLPEYEREVIRKHAWGRFEDLLRATAESPAMLFYLDNWLSADPEAGERMAPGRRRFGLRRLAQAGAGQADNRRRRGLNENYAREIMELHTLGVDGGYTQKDVAEVARCFTGWTIAGLREQKVRFRFEPRLHDPGDKVVLGQRIAGRGKEEGDRVIHLLATHPSTARFVSHKLARRFVSDDPPAALIDRAAAVFRRTDGDIRAVVETIVTSPEFFADPTRQAKVKTPLELVASALRASGAEVRDARALARRLGQMGMPLYMQQPPTGYKDTADAWVSTSGLLARLNFALDLAAGRIPGVDVAAAGGTAEEAAARLVPGGLGDATRRTLAKERTSDPARVAGLILGSPEFQRR